MMELQDPLKPREIEVLRLPALHLPPVSESVLFL